MNEWRVFGCLQASVGVRTFSFCERLNLKHDAFGKGVHRRPTRRVDSQWRQHLIGHQGGTLTPPPCHLRICGSITCVGEWCRAGSPKPVRLCRRAVSARRAALRCCSESDVAPAALILVGPRSRTVWPHFNQAGRPPAVAEAVHDPRPFARRPARSGWPHQECRRARCAGRDGSPVRPRTPRSTD